MPVQRSLTPRVRALIFCVAVAPVTAACAHTEAETIAPETQQRESELAQLRRENASLRTRVAHLEEQLRLLEREGGALAGNDQGYSAWDSVSVSGDGAWAEAGPAEGTPRQLPVVRLTPEGGSIERPERPASPGEGGRSISLSPVPHSGAPDGHTGGSYTVDARGEVDEHGQAASPDFEPPQPAGEPAKYRLVGSRLVQATKTKSTSRGDKRGKNTGGPVVKDYKSAMAIYRDGRFAEAEAAFGKIVREHPNHDYADNALYWQGEAAYDQAHYADALAAFTKVVERYGGGNKAPDALLKIGLCYGRLGDTANARDVLAQLIAAYPRADASKIAKRKLAELD